MRRAVAARAAQDADDAGLADAAMRFDPPALQLLGDDAGCAHLLEADFGMGVEIVADGGEFVGIGVDGGECGHGSVLYG